MRWKYPLLTAFFLVLLRLAIGWHFFYEGYHKVHSLSVGPVIRDGRTVPPFSSAGYFSEGRGPLGEVMRHAIGDPDEKLLERLEVAPMPAEKESAKDNKARLVPPVIARDWEAYVGRFSTYYGLDESQRSKAQEKLQEAETKFAEWLNSGSKAIVKTYPSGTVDVTESTPQRIEEYRSALREVHDVYAKKLPAFGRDVEKARLLKTKTDAVQLRKSLEADIDDQTELLKKSLGEILTPAQRDRDNMPEVEAPVFLKYLDTGTAWFLFGVGATLLLGVVTRTSCVLAAGFLLMTYLNTPAFPWLPVPPQQEGSYYFVSKNVIEMLALLTLATTPSGRWFGIDAVFHQLRRAMFGVPARELAQSTGS
jgi:uncharacterized membrane protein YphA (DoxX/SURF4 family)